MVQVWGILGQMMDKWCIHILILEYRSHLFQLHLTLFKLTNNPYTCKEKEISTEWPIHIYCSEQFNILNYFGKVQLEVTTEQSLYVQPHLNFYMYNDSYKTIITSTQWIVPQIFKLPPKHIFFDLLIRFITNRKYAFFCIFKVRLSPDNIILLYWITIDHVQF